MKKFNISREITYKKDGQKMIVVVSLPENNYRIEREYYILNLKQFSWGEESKAKRKKIKRKSKQRLCLRIKAKTRVKYNK